MVGQLKILELRQKATDALDGRFDVKRFHTVVLGQKAMPLEMPEKRVQEWIRAKSAASP